MYQCVSCKKEFTKWQGKCDSCQEWNTLEEHSEERLRGRKSKRLRTITPQKFNQKKTSSPRLESKIVEFDRVLGGGFVPGEIVLLAGSPGIGKSTLLLQIAEKIGKHSRGKVLYVAGEESLDQIGHRADRLHLDTQNIEVLEHRDVDEITAHLASHPKEYSLCIIDSIQTMHTQDVTSAAGSLSQVTESADRISNNNKKIGLATIIVGHITKSGSIAGPKTLEHLVDAVLEFEGDKFHHYRLLRSKKNRFGSVDEVGVFEMSHGGLKEIKNPSDSFIEQRVSSPGSVITITMEGTRPMLFEVQALVTQSYFPNPRRTSSGIDYNRLLLLTAVLEKKGNLPLSEKDIYVNISGGAKIQEPAADLAVCAAIISSAKDKVLDSQTALFGEVGLLGEVRSVPFEKKRISEAKKLGFKKVLTPSNVSSIQKLISKFR